MKTNIQKSLYLSSVLLVALSGCRKDPIINQQTCADHSAGSAYSIGVDTATQQNQAQYNLGAAAGAALTYEQGLAEGKAIAYNNGYNNNATGYPAGYNAFYPSGYSAGNSSTVACNSGQTQGVNNGITNGSHDGQIDGDNDGYYDGFDQGYVDGYDDGYDEGYYVGANYAYENPETCPGYSEGVAGRSSSTAVAQKTSGKDIDWNNACQVAGYNATINLQANYNLGYANAKAANTQYQNGLATGKVDTVSYNNGAVAGYDAGKNKGYSDGFDKGYQDRFNACYNAVYTNAYNNAYWAAYDSAYNYAWYDGYDEGYYGTDEGFDDGYEVGYYDGFDDQCYIMGYRTTSNSKMSSTAKTSKETLKFEIKLRKGPRTLTDGSGRTKSIGMAKNQTVTSLRALSKPASYVGMSAKGAVAFDAKRIGGIRQTKGREAINNRIASQWPSRSMMSRLVTIPAGQTFTPRSEAKVGPKPTFRYINPGFGI